LESAGYTNLFGPDQRLAEKKLCSQLLFTMQISKEWLYVQNLYSLGYLNCKFISSNMYVIAAEYLKVYTVKCNYPFPAPLSPIFRTTQISNLLFSPSTFSFPYSKHRKQLAGCESTLHALRVPRVADLASIWRNTLSRSRPANTTALAPMLGLSTAAATARCSTGSRLAGRSSLAASHAARRRWGAAAAAASAAAESRAKRPDLEVRERDGRVRAVCLDVCGLAGCDRACAASRARLGRCGGIGAVKPEHVDCVVVPDRQDEDLAAVHGLTHSCEAAHGAEGVGIAESGLLGCAPGVADVVLGGNASDVGDGVGDDVAVLDVETLDGGPVRCDELYDDRDWLGCVDNHTLAIERGVAHAVGVEITIVLVAHSVVSLASCVITTLDTGASSLAGDSARVRCIRL
jgi:hypothetical protein